MFNGGRNIQVTVNYICWFAISPREQAHWEGWGGGGGGGVSWGGTPGPMTNKQVESCFLNHNSSIHFLYWFLAYDTLVVDLVWVSLCGELEEGAKFPFALGPKNYLGGPAREYHEPSHSGHNYKCSCWFTVSPRGYQEPSESVLFGIEMIY
jgi:hypothetical protein